MPAKRTDITDDVINEILMEMSVGESFKKACNSRGFLHTTIWGRIQKSATLYDRYTRAREQRSDCIFEEMEELEQLVLQGKINPKAYRAVADTMKWRLGRMKPSTYGEKQTVEHTGTINIASEIATARRAAIIERIEQPAVADDVQDAVIIKKETAKQMSLPSMPDVDG